jgi:hypothetical protein
MSEVDNADTVDQKAEPQSKKRVKPPKPEPMEKQLVDAINRYLEAMNPKQLADVLVQMVEALTAIEKNTRELGDIAIAVANVEQAVKELQRADDATVTVKQPPSTADVDDEELDRGRKAPPPKTESRSQPPEDEDEFDVLKGIEQSHRSYLDVADTHDATRIYATQYLGKSMWSAINKVLWGRGFRYVSAGKNSHWERRKQ